MKLLQVKSNVNTLCFQCLKSGKVNVSLLHFATLLLKAKCRKYPDRLLMGNKNFKITFFRYFPLKILPHFQQNIHPHREYCVLTPRKYRSRNVPHLNSSLGRNEFLAEMFHTSTLHLGGVRSWRGDLGET